MNGDVFGRKRVPAEAYRFLALAFLGSRGDAGATKGDLAWETRANHAMATRVLAELSRAGHVAIDGSASGYRIRVTPAGRSFLDAHLEYGRVTFSGTLEAHFRFGRRPTWLPF